MAESAQIQPTNPRLVASEYREQQVSPKHSGHSASAQVIPARSTKSNGRSSQQQQPPSTKSIAASNKAVSDVSKLKSSAESGALRPIQNKVIDQQLPPRLASRREAEEEEGEHEVLGSQRSSEGLSVGVSEYEAAREAEEHTQHTYKQHS